MHYIERERERSDCLVINHWISRKSPTGDPNRFGGLNIDPEPPVRETLVFPNVAIIGIGAEASNTQRRLNIYANARSLETSGKIT